MISLTKKKMLRNNRCNTFACLKFILYPSVYHTTRRYSTDVRAEWPPFSALLNFGYDWPPFFDKKYTTDPIFDDWCMKGPTFPGIPVYAHIFHSEIFEAACSLGIQWFDCIICLTTSNKWVQKNNQRAVYDWVIISDDLVYEGVRFFKGHAYEWGRFRNTGSHTRNYPQVTPPPPPLAPRIQGGYVTWFLEACKLSETHFLWKGAHGKIARFKVRILCTFLRLYTTDFH